ncbi:PREDICTED: uncharacterized protein LOC109590381 [Amphimedon queenslandica]|uniref:Uncharacterized protein n=1 Tax=Amphimedon queenslandica TaxID=400682 RepID=A0AAN0JXN1_AMPQE|nr:PREDICTED: uncharacterized protein LOC109590381 [Amphimedon queenslandica]|eukprot:XP_019861864.1 PREDICTED: uncharacterized protein LOC109590381 [Amphimedon queenslandica]
MSVEIRLTPDNFTTNGQYHFTLPTPLNVSSGYRIGVYQPPDDRSVVRFHYMNLPTNIDGTGKIQSDKINDTDIKISGGMNRDVEYKSWNILIYPIVQNTSCYTQLLPPESIMAPYSITNSIFISDTRIFPDIRFTCHGIITNWIVNILAQFMPVIKIKHSNNLTTTAATLNTSASNAVTITSLLYNFTMSNEITVQPGDILMIESNATNYMFYQQYNGPHNYRLGDNNELIVLDTNDYPLISVVVEPFTNTATSTISSTHINTVTTVLPSSSIHSTATVTMESMEYTKTNSILSNSLSLIIGTTSVMSTPVSTLQSTGSNTLILAGSISTAVFILLVVAILAILIVSVLVCRKIWYRTSNGNDTFSSDERKADINQQSNAPNMENTLLASTNPAYGVTGENCNTDVSTNPAYGITEKSGVSANPAYGINTGGGIESINEEALVYDEPRTMMYNEQKVTIMQNEAYGQL